MADVGKYTDRELEERRRDTEAREGGMSSLLALGAVSVVAGIFMGTALMAAGFVAGIAGWVGKVYFENALTVCKAEQKYRADLSAPDIPGQVSTVKSPARGFNPAAAIVLENDMKPMSPLRLKRKEFARC